MPTINQLSAVDQINDGDQFPLYSPNAGDARKASFTTVKESLAGDFASLADLAAQTGAGLVGCNGGTTVQQELDAISASGGASLVGFIQSGTGAVARTVQAKLRESVSVADFGADPTGVADSQGFFTATFAASKATLTSPGTYKLTTDATITGAFSWRQSPTVAYTGPGAVLVDDAPEFNYAPDLRYTSLAEMRGTTASPDTSQHAVALFARHSLTGDTGSRPNPTLVVQHYMWGTATEARAQAIYAEVTAKASGSATFVEGIRAHGIVPDGITSKAYGGLFYAQNGGTGLNAIAAEAEVRRTIASDGLPPRDWTGVEQFDGMYLATANTANGAVGGTGGKPNFAFAVNPFNTIPVRAAFLVPQCLQVGGKTVDHTAFACLETGLVYGLDLAEGTYSTAAIALPNNSAVRAYNAAGSAQNNILFYSTSNRVSLGFEASGVDLLAGKLIYTASGGQAFNMYAVSDTGQKVDLLIKPPNPGSHNGTAWGGVGIEHRVSGSGANGPVSGDYALRISSMKAAWPSPSTIGEVGCLDLTARNDNGDVSAVLVNVQHTVGAGFLCAWEGSSSQIDPGAGFALTHQVQTQIGVINSGTGEQIGFYATPEVGTPTNGVLIRSTGARVWASAYAYVKDGTTLFDISGTGVMTVGTFTSNADTAITGYVTIKTTDGTTRKLATIA